jgi:hypothetical protein
VLLLGEVLVPLALSDEFLSIAQGCGPVESSSEGLADQRTRRRVVAADAFVDLLQDVLAFFPGNTLREYSRSGAPPVELSALFVALSVALTSGILVVVGFISGCIARQLVC